MSGPIIPVDLTALAETSTNRRSATTAEVGHPGGHAPSWHHHLGPGYTAQGYEENPDLVFPHSIGIIDQMRTDSRVAGLIRAIFQAVLAAIAKAHLEENPDVKPEVARLVETELGLVRPGQHVSRRATLGPTVGVNWVEHATQALAAPIYGFMPFFKVWAPGPPTPEQADVAAKLRELRGTDTIVHLSRLAPRLPRTINEVRVMRNGDLAGVLQAGIGWDTAGRTDGLRVVGGPGMEDAIEQFIDAKDLLFYCFEREGADWTGKSLLRSAYGPWRLKVEAVLTDAMAGERQGMGLPVVYYGENGTKEEALAIATAARTGSAAGVAAKKGDYELHLMGVEGQVHDTLGSAKFHGQEIAEGVLAHVLTLGHEGGIGQGTVADVFKELFAGGLNTIVRWYLETVTEGLVRELVAWNFPGEVYPQLVTDEISAESALTAEALKSLVDAKVINPDPALEADARRRYGLPSAPEGVTIDNVPGEDGSPGTLEPMAIEPGQIVRDQGAEDDPSGNGGIVDPVVARALTAAERIVELRSKATAGVPAD